MGLTPATARKSPHPINTSIRNLAQLKSRWWARRPHHIQIILTQYNFLFIQRTGITPTSFNMQVPSSCLFRICSLCHQIALGKGLLAMYSCPFYMESWNPRSITARSSLPWSNILMVSGFNSFIFPPSSILKSRPKFPVQFVAHWFILPNHISAIPVKSPHLLPS